MSFRRLCLTLCWLGTAFASHAQISKGDQILINRGFQIHGSVSTYDTFHLSTFSNANYTTVNWIWNAPRSFDGSMPLLGTAPGFPWGRWVSDENDMPPQGDEASYTNQLAFLQLSDEPNLDDPTVRDRFVNWINSVRSNWPNTIIAVNDGGGVADGNLIDFINRGRPDMITFDNYPWKSVYDTNQPDHIGAAIGGPPTTWYSVLRIHRDISRAFNIPFGSYVQTFHAVEEYGPHNVYRDPSPSELRLNHFGALAFNAKLLNDFHYNNGSSPLFTSPGGDSFPTALYYEKADCALRCRNFGKTLVRLKPIDDAITPCNAAPLTTSILFIRGRNSSGVLNPIPLNFCAGNGFNPTTDWVYQRNDPYLTGWTVANQGTKNNGQIGDVVVSWFKPLDETFDGPNYTNEIYMMVVNGLTETNGTAADCTQEIKLNFTDELKAVEMLNSLTGQPEVKVLPLTNGVRQLVLNLNGGDAALFKFSDGAPFIGAPFTGPPVIAAQPQSRRNAEGTDASFTVVATGDAPLAFQWRFSGTNISGATKSIYTRANVQSADAGSYNVIITNAAGSVTSTAAVLSIAPPPPPAPLLYEPFNYTNFGGTVTANTPENWIISSGSGSDDFNITAGNLSYAGLPSSIGNSATNGGAGLAVRRLVGQTINSGTVYFSVLFNLVSYGGWTGGSVTSGAQVCALTASDNATFRVQILVKSNTPSSYLIGVQKGGSGSTSTFSTTPANLGSTVLLVGKYDFTQTPNPVTLWINPSASTFGDIEPASGSITASSGTDNLGIDRFNFRQNVLTGTSSLPGFMQWDELRIGTNWTTVTPARVKPRFDLADFISTNTIRFQASGDPGTIIVEASTNLLNWLEITNLFSASGSFEFTESSTNQARRFYRLKLSP